MLLLSPGFLRVGLPPGETDTPFDPAAAQGMRMVQIQPSVTEPADASATVEPPAQQAPAVQVTQPSAAPPAAPGRTPAARTPRTPAPTPSTPRAGRRADPLQPGYRDPRLYIAPRDLPPPAEPTAEQLHARYMAHLQGRIDAYNDSIGAVAERERKARDWTYTDKDGNRWGAADGKIYLGGVELPGTHVLGNASGDKQRAAEEEARTREEIASDEAVRAQRENFKERTRATREQKGAERRGKPPGPRF